MLGGEFPLVRMFWIGLVLGGYFIVPLIAVLVGGLVGAILFPLIGTYRLGLALAGIAIVLYWIVALVGTWRSASNYEGKLGWGSIAKGAVIVIAILAVLRLPDLVQMIMAFATSG